MLAKAKNPAQLSTSVEMIQSDVSDVSAMSILTSNGWMKETALNAIFADILEKFQNFILVNVIWMV
jgi:hypothetical protein